MRGPTCGSALPRLPFVRAGPPPPRRAPLTLLPQRRSGLAPAILPAVPAGEGRQRVLALFLRLPAQLLGRAARTAARLACTAGPARGAALGARRPAGPAARLAPAAAAAALLPPALRRAQHLEGVGLVIEELIEAVGDDAPEALLQVSGHDGPPSAGSCADATGAPRALLAAAQDGGP